MEHCIAFFLLLTYGLAATFEESLLEELRETAFALNMDESMNSNNQEVVTVLVSHFSSSLHKISVNHLASFVVTRVRRTCFRNWYSCLWGVNFLGLICFDGFVRS